MFGPSPSGLLAKVEAEETCDDSIPVLPFVKEVSENTVNQGQKGQITCCCATLNQCASVKEVDHLNSTSEPIPLIPLSDLPPLEAAFSIEKIWKAIFSFLEPSDLFTCRLVSSSWLRMAHDELVKWRLNKISISKRRQRCGEIPCFEAGGIWGTGMDGTYEDLTDVLDGVGPHPFPCSSFLLESMTMHEIDYLKFFERYGHLSKYLQFIFQSYDYHENEGLVYGKDSVLKFVTKLITEQTPNLETLIMGFPSGVKFNGRIQPKLLASIKQGSYCSPKNNENLLTLIFFGVSIPHEIVEASCCLAPKLERLVTDLGFFAENKHRLHLLREMEITPSRNWENGDSIKTIVSIGEKLNLLRLCVHFGGLKDAPELWSDIANLLKRIFDMSCHSLEFILLKPIYYLPGTTLLQMPKVTKLILEAGPKENLVKLGWSFFPPGIALAITFPNLHTIEFRQDENKDAEAEATVLTSFLSMYKTEQMGSVKRIITFRRNVDEKVWKNVFPNAVVSRDST